MTTWKNKHAINLKLMRSAGRPGMLLGRFVAPNFTIHMSCQWYDSRLSTKFKLSLSQHAYQTWAYHHSCWILPRFHIKWFLLMLLGHQGDFKCFLFLASYFQILMQWSPIYFDYFEPFRNDWQMIKIWLSFLPGVRQFINYRLLCSQGRIPMPWA